MLYEFSLIIRTDWLERERKIISDKQMSDEEFNLQGMAEQAEHDALSSAEQFVIDIDGFEGPLDLMLALARTHKLDIAKISILDLAEQYLAFIDNARDLKLQVAGDYLVMAAWLAFLKSKLLLPREDDTDELTGEEMAAHLAFRLKRLQAMRDASDQLMARARLGRDFFARGMPEHTRKITSRKYNASLYDLLRAYGRQIEVPEIARVTIKARKVWSIKDARTRLENMLGLNLDWKDLTGFLREYFKDEKKDVSAVASSFGATLEMARDGFIEIRQAHAFAPIYFRRKGEVEWQKAS